jgi:hypothetical protein
VELPEFTKSCLISLAERPRGINWQAVIGDDVESQNENIGAES